MAKYKKYSKNYFKIGFTSVSDDDKEKPQCVLCYAVFSNEAKKPSKLKRHLQQKHPAEHMEIDLVFFQTQKLSLKRQKLLASGYIYQQSTASVQASFDVALQTAKYKKPHAIGETLLKPCALNIVKLILDETSAKKIQQVSLSINTIKRRISLTTTDVKQRVIHEIKASPMFSINSTNQLMSHHARSFWFLLVTYIRKTSKKNFCIVMC